MIHFSRGLWIYLDQKIGPPGWKVVKMPQNTEKFAKNKKRLRQQSHILPRGRVPRGFSQVVRINHQAFLRVVGRSICRSLTPTITRLLLLASRSNTGLLDGHIWASPKYYPGSLRFSERLPVGYEKLIALPALFSPHYQLFFLCR